MFEYLIRRTIRLVPTLVIISFVIFLVIDLPPGTYLDRMRAELASEGQVGRGARTGLERLEQRYGLDKPLHTRYWIWITGVVQGDLGRSFLFETQVSELIGERFLLTLIIVVGAFAFSWLVAIPLGVYSATHQYSPGDHILSLFGFIGLSLPNFLFALLMIVLSLTVFDINIMGGLFSPAFEDAPWSLARFIDLIGNIWAPILVVGTYYVAEIMRIMRSQMLDALNSPFLKTARSKGLKEYIVIYKHAFPIAINALISYAGMMIPRIISATVIVSLVLSLPTLGSLYYEGLLYRDMYLVGSIFLLLSLTLIFGNLAADFLLGFTDPRIRYE